MLVDHPDEDTWEDDDGGEFRLLYVLGGVVGQGSTSVVDQSWLFRGVVSSHRRDACRRGSWRIIQS
jgi:hypothetical protein